MSIRLKVAIIFTAALAIGYFTGVYTTKISASSKITESRLERDAALSEANELKSRLYSMCGDAVLKFVPCPSGLEVCVCGGPDKYLKK